jgi:hypothetical protein
LRIGWENFNPDQFDGKKPWLKTLFDGENPWEIPIFIYI